MEVYLGRIIKPESASKERTLMTRSIAYALRELMKQTEINDRTKDITAYIVLTLRAIGKTIDSSVEAWEKRGYWLKADKYRLEWDWTERLGEALYQALTKGDWSSVAIIAAQITEKLKNVQLPKTNRIGSPWEGARKSLRF